MTFFLHLTSPKAGNSGVTSLAWGPRSICFSWPFPLVGKGVGVAPAITTFKVGWKKTYLSGERNIPRHSLQVSVCSLLPQLCSEGQFYLHRAGECVLATKDCHLNNEWGFSQQKGKMNEIDVLVIYFCAIY